MQPTQSIVMQERKKYEAIVRNLGGKALESNDVDDSWQQDVTHLAMPAPTRSQQVRTSWRSVLACTHGVHCSRLDHAMSGTLQDLKGEQTPRSCMANSGKRMVDAGAGCTRGWRVAGVYSLP